MKKEGQRFRVVSSLPTRRLGKTTMVEFVNGQRQRNRVRIDPDPRFRWRLRACYAPTIALLRLIFFYFAIESFFCSSIHRIFRRALFAKTEYREKMRVEITVPINLPSRPLISASKLELFFCNSELTGCKSCLG